MTPEEKEGLLEVLGLTTDEGLEDTTFEDEDTLDPSEVSEEIIYEDDNDTDDSEEEGDTEETFDYVEEMEE